MKKMAPGGGLSLQFSTCFLREYGISKNKIFFRAEMERKKQAKNSKPHIKKPLNAFMLYMKEQRAKVVSECTLKESAAINQILGRKVSYSY